MTPEMTRDELIMSHLGYAAAVAYNNGLFGEDVGIASEALILAVDNYDPSRGATLKTYIGLMVRYAVLDHFSKMKRRREVSLESIAEPSTNGTEQKLIDKDMAFKIMRFAKVMGVPRDAYTLLTLRYFHGLDQNEIAEKCYIGQSRVSHVLASAEQRIGERAINW